MRLLDLCCGAGGAAMGYHRAGFEVVGVDIDPQPRYPFEFHQADAMTYPLDGFDAIHASPPCQDHSTMSALTQSKHGTGWMLHEMIDRLDAHGAPWVVENVEGASMLRQNSLFGRFAIVLCGSTFGLSTTVNGVEYGLVRHRRFESNIPLIQPSCNHRLPTVGVYGHGETSSIRHKRGFQVSTAAARREVMGMPWANRDEIAQAIPPAYTEYIGAHLLEHLEVAA